MDYRKFNLLKRAKEGYGNIKNKIYTKTLDSLAKAQMNSYVMMEISKTTKKLCKSCKRKVHTAVGASSSLSDYKDEFAKFDWCDSCKPKTKELEKFFNESMAKEVLKR